MKLLIMLVFFPLSLLAQVTWYASPTGTGIGTIGDPSSLDVALLHSHPDTSISLLEGIYVPAVNVDGITFMGKGYINTDSTLRSVIRAHTGARVIITRTDSLPPYIFLRNGTRVAGIWFVGMAKSDTNESPCFNLSSDTEVDSCVLQNYAQGINSAVWRTKVKNCLFVNNGLGALYHAVYYSDGSPTSYAYGDSCYRNIFIGNPVGGYSISMWHGPSYSYVAKNFVSTGRYAFCTDGHNQTIIDNIWWGWTDSGGLTLGSTMTNIYYEHNLVGPRRDYYAIGSMEDDTAEVYPIMFASSARNATMENGVASHRTWIQTRILYDSTESLALLGVHHTRISAMSDSLLANFATGTYEDWLASSTIPVWRDSLLITVDSWAGDIAIPSVLTDPVSGTTAKDGTRVFSITSTGSPITYQWQKNSVNISGATSSSYTATATWPENHGAQFRAIVTNAAGSDTSAAAVLSILLPKRGFKIR